MARGARHGVAGHTFAFALRERLKLADGTHAFLVLSSQNKVAHKIRNIVAGLKLIEVSPWLLDGSVAFEMTLHAHRIAPRR